jgi:two-component system, cell cycle response regulator DivK
MLASMESDGPTARFTLITDEQENTAVANELILIVEDNEKNMKLIRDLLNFNGYRTIEAVTAEDGLELARDRLPALILMDIQLPQMDGITAFRYLQADAATKSIPVVAVTASATKQEREEILAAGFDGLEVKPLKLNEFLKKVREVLDGRTAARGKPREA